ncbi:MAG: hypothetical protein HY958_01490 [Bacteroidia bacterium]|nr:hypothetical protein [Bacteroidia bacterium]
MEININCQCCGAQNTLSKTSLNCRRCQSDLSLIFILKLHSYKYRYWAALHITQNNFDKAKACIKRAVYLCKE